MNKTFILIATTVGVLAGCTGSREMYNKNGLKIVQVGADPTPINGGYNILISEVDGTSTVVAVTATSSVAQQLAAPAAAVGAAVVLRPDEINSSTTTNVLQPTRIQNGGTRRRNP